MADLCHLHAHSAYSLPIGLDGYSSPADLVARAVELGQSAIALTDHGSLYGVIELQKAAKKAGIKSIVGTELYTSEHHHSVKDASNKTNYHLLALAMNDQGYRNLLKLTTIAHTEGFYYRPRVSRAAIEQHHDGIIFTSACLSGEINSALRGGDRAKAERVAGAYRDLLGDRFYLELQYHPAVPELHDLNLELIRLGKKLGVALVATSDAHFAWPDQAEAHRFSKASRWGKTLEDFCGIEPTLDTTFAMLGAAELWPHFSAYGSDGLRAFENTVVIADRCNVTLGHGRVNLPPMALPEGETAESYLRQVAWDGLRAHGKDHMAPYRDRLEYELDVINKTGFPDYMLIVWDMVRYARSRGIPCLPRGSAGASLVLHCLGISDVDPLENQLLFERFLSPERLEMPDIDIDFADEARDQIVQYLADTYGRENVAQIMTFGTLQAKQAIRDAARTLAVPLDTADRLAKLVPFKASTVKQALAQSPDMAALAERDPTCREVLETASWIEGTVKSVGTHACGVVVSAEPLIDLVPLQPTKDGGRMAAFEGPTLADLGLLKMDILGSTNLSVVSACFDLIAERHGVRMTLADIPLDDPAVFAALGRGETANVFQLEGPGITRYLAELKPTRVGDIYAMVALYRPGPLEQIPIYIRNKNNPAQITYLHPILEPILSDTYGVIVYQEQIMLLLQAIAGYTLGEAYIVLKAIGKKKKDLMAKEEPRFKNGCLKNGLTQEQADHLWDLIQPFAGYSFNRPHATLYGLLSYQTAWLKVNYPTEYMAATISREMGAVDRVASACAEARRLGVAVLPPSVNYSGREFAIESDTSVRFGLSAIKNVGDSAVEGILSERTENGLYEGFEDFIARTAACANKRALESLIQAGACDEWGLRQSLLSALPELLKSRAALKKRRAARPAGAVAMFDLDALEAEATKAERAKKRTTGGFPAGVGVDDSNEWRLERLGWERELLGFYLTNHPVTEHLNGQPRNPNWLPLGEIGAIEPDSLVAGVALVQALKTVRTKKGDSMAILTLSDESGSVSAVLFPRAYAAIQAPAMLVDTVIGWRGRVDVSRGEPQIILNDIGPLSLVASPPRLRYRELTGDQDAEPVMLGDEDDHDDARPDSFPAPVVERAAGNAPVASQDGPWCLVLPRTDLVSYRRLSTQVAAILRGLPHDSGARPLYLCVLHQDGRRVYMESGLETRPLLDLSVQQRLMALGVAVELFDPARLTESFS